MESAVKRAAGSTAPVASGLLPDGTGTALGATASIPVAQALAAIGEPDTTQDLAQRLAATVAMLWSDIARSDMFLPQGASGELRGERDPYCGDVLLGAVGVPSGDLPGVQVIPITPTRVSADPITGRGSTMSAAVVAGSTIEGFLIVQRREGAAEFSNADLDGLEKLARGIGPLLPRIRERGGRSAAAWFQRDMATARETQRTFLPRPLATNSAGVRMLAEYLPAFEVGGDFYDFVDLGDGRLLAAIGDVSGKGVTAALMMSRISSELHHLAASTSGPAEILGRLNGSIQRDMQDDRFVTVVCVLLDVPNRRWVVSNAGHVVPILRRASGAVSGLAYSSGPPVGMLPGSEYAEEVFPLESRDILVLATDGAFDNLEGQRRPCSTMGQCKLTEVIEKAPHDLAEIHRRIVSAVQSMSTTSGRQQLQDDVALLGLELMV